MIEIPTWFVPSSWGDIRVTAAGADRCLVTAEKLSDAERRALESLSVHARRKGWLDESAPTIGEGDTAVAAPVAKVAKVIAGVLKPDRKLISAVVFADGVMQEHRDLVEKQTAAGDGVVVLPKAKARVKAATTVAAPVLGCPAPDFEAAELRAQRVLESFLTEPQIEDFRRHNRFVTVGASGRRYMVTSRHARDQLAVYHRSLFDLDAGHPLCVHDYDVPAPEEMLGIHLLLSLPGWEPYLRRLEGEDQEPIRFFGPGMTHVLQDAFGRDLH